MKKLAIATFLTISMSIVSINVVQAKTTKPAVRAHAICKDSTTSYSVNRSGTCSHHKGVKTWLY